MPVNASKRLYTQVASECIHEVNKFRAFLYKQKGNRRRVNLLNQVYTGFRDS